MTPKYWIAHDNTTDDVIIETAAKMLSECQRKTYEYFRYFIGQTRIDEDDLIDAQIKLEEEYPEIEFRLFEIAYPKSEDFGPDATLVAPKPQVRPEQMHTHVPTDAETQRMHDTR